MLVNEEAPIMAEVISQNGQALKLEVLAADTPEDVSLCAVYLASIQDQQRQEAYLSSITEPALKARMSVEMARLQTTGSNSRDTAQDQATQPPENPDSTDFDATRTSLAGYLSQSDDVDASVKKVEAWDDLGSSFSLNPQPSPIKDASTSPRATPQQKERLQALQQQMEGLMKTLGSKGGIPQSPAQASSGGVLAVVEPVTPAAPPAPTSATNVANAAALNEQLQQLRAHAQALLNKQPVQVSVYSAGAKPQVTQLQTDSLVSPTYKQAALDPLMPMHSAGKKEDVYAENLVAGINALQHGGSDEIQPAPPVTTPTISMVPTLAPTDAVKAASGSMLAAKPTATGSSGSTATDAEPPRIVAAIPLDGLFKTPRSSALPPTSPARQRLASLEQQAMDILTRRTSVNGPAAAAGQIALPPMPNAPAGQLGAVTSTHPAAATLKPQSLGMAPTGVDQFKQVPAHRQKTLSVEELRAEAMKLLSSRPSGGAPALGAIPAEPVVRWTAADI